MERTRVDVEGNLAFIVGALELFIATNIEELESSGFERAKFVLLEARDKAKEINNQLLEDYGEVAGIKLVKG